VDDQHHTGVKMNLTKVECFIIGVVLGVLFMTGWWLAMQPAKRTTRTVFQEEKVPIWDMLPEPTPTSTPKLNLPAESIPPTP
jgi:hypothetical protein